MKPAKRITATFSAIILATYVHAQGRLTPPGAPAPTMKTLEQVEPRTPLDETIGTITSPGSYYLTANRTSSIVIEADDVTLDLMGFRMAGEDFSIRVSGNRRNLRVCNGTITSAEVGIDAGNLAEGHFEGLRFVGNPEAGINGGSGCTIEHCTFARNGSFAISSRSNTTVKACRITDTQYDALVLSGSGSLISDNIIVDNGSTGIWLFGAGNRLSGNIVKGNGDNYNLAQGNQLNLLLCEIPETLDWPCSVKLDGTLTCTNTATDGISVNANDVTIDLAGHALIGPGASSGHGIYQASTFRNLAVFNGKSAHWSGSVKGGVYAAGSDSRISEIQAMTNYYGIYTGSGSTLSDCAANNNTGYGFSANFGCTLSDCVAHDNTGIGIFASYGSTLSGCVALDNTGYGIYAIYGCTLSGCAARGNTGTGIYASPYCSLSGCAAHGNTGTGIYASDGCTLGGCEASHNNNGDGIYASQGCTLSDCATSYNFSDGIEIYSDNRVVNCVCYGNGWFGDGAGIHATSSDNRIEGNSVTDNDRGIDVDLAGNFIVRNSASGNTLNWDVAAGNVCLVVQATTAGAISGNSGGTAPGSTDPNANFTY